MRNIFILLVVLIPITSFAQEDSSTWPTSACIHFANQGHSEYIETPIAGLKISVYEQAQILCKCGTRANGNTAQHCNYIPSYKQSADYQCKTDPDVLGGKEKFKIFVKGKLACKFLFVNKVQAGGWVREEPIRF